ncbi:CAP domain-containing protein [Lysinibacillus sp. SGAir0095]|uniref:CAP domain-containing protein n=1 Tax=Lysinibacillus sp. SGAir0095 TaxID=2070463 RepID=UPI0010CCB5A7|nr:CAP domain-containing protein [Lysinibacillus sp. SGAir0095]QCR32408.1 hypothetical protein C1N55_09560 [Lysinibacillus sp. SGAir0095]
MKKWFITFCALGLISTQVPTADAASNQEESQDKYIKHEVKVVNMNQYGDLLADFKNEVSFTNIHSFKDLSKKLQISKETLEKLIGAQLQEYTNSLGKRTPAAASKNESTKEDQESNAVETPVVETPSGEIEETPVTAVPDAQESKKEKEVKAPQTPAMEQHKPVQSTPSAPTEEVEKTTQSNSPVAEADAASAFETKVVELTNAERAKNGLAPLEIYNPLMEVAGAKSQDMATNNYFSHTSPTYGSPFDQIKSAGITYRAAGENIAQGQRTPEEVVQAWMNSEGHRANILNASFTHIGVGYVENGNYWTQQFIQL